MKSVEEIRRQAIYKKSWKSAGLGAECFNPLPILQPALIDGWTKMKIEMPQRSYE